MARSKTNILSLSTVKHVSMVGGRDLLIESKPDSNLVSIIEPDGTASLTILLTQQGPILHLKGKTLAIEAKGDISIEAENISIHSRKATRISSDTDLNLEAKGKTTSNAAEHSICSQIGDVRVKANDDVKLKGERIKLNC